MLEQMVCKWHPSFKLKIVNCVQNQLIVFQLLDLRFVGLSGTQFTKEMS